MGCVRPYQASELENVYYPLSAPEANIYLVTQPYLVMTFIWTSATRVLDGDPHA